ncbi:hypothetical protein AMATHDRAFT_1880 [Amanita thiersii Skay4041]|uniref:Uncharacterized protein n=1 Tax=Amanita thiersii Skay4041 TaxID=703135 RepID=A0A2A9NRV4_9AGAR|nr:hypothetical protein AMATHDRAFT_1880 [Amanita thiersii Skay4041]
MASSYPNSIPTPPFSPQFSQSLPHDHDNPLRPTINLLDSLVTFYQQERMWVYRTRATLEHAFQDDPSPCGDECSIQPPAENRSLDSSARQKHKRSRSDTASSDQPASRWMHRKKRFKLRLDGLSPRHKHTATPVSQSPKPGLHTREHILELFDKMIEARMESCQRVNQLVRNANRADIHFR